MTDLSRRTKPPEARALDSIQRARTPSTPRVRPALVSLALAVTLATTLGCGNSGSSDGGTTGTAGTGGGGGGIPTSTSSRLEVFQASLLAIDPNDPTTVIDLDPEAADLDGESNTIAALPIVTGTWVGGAIANPRVEAVVYARKDRTLARVSTNASNGTPTPEPVGADELPPLVCDTTIGPDLADFESTRILFGEADQDCSERLSYRAITLSDDTITESRFFPGQPISPLVDRATGAHTGWLSLFQSDLVRLDDALDVEAGGLLSSVRRGSALGITKDAFVIIEVDQSIYTFDPETNALSDALFTFETPCPCDRHFATDGELAFANDESELFRIDLGSGDVRSIDAPTDVAMPFGFFSIPTFVLSGDTRVTWSYLSDGDGNPQTFEDLRIVWRSVGKDGESGFTVDSIDAQRVQSFAFLGFQALLVGDRLFYNTFAIESGTALPSIEVNFPIPNQPSSGDGALSQELIVTLVGPGAQPADPSIRGLAVQRDLTPGSTPDIREDALWAGASVPDALSLANFDGARRVHRLTNLPDLSDFEANTVGVRLEALDPMNPSAPETPLGTLPDGVRYAFLLPGIGPERLAVAIAPDGQGETQTDILFCDEDEADSLIQITDTPGVAEFPVGLF